MRAEMHRARRIQTAILFLTVLSSVSCPSRSTNGPQEFKPNSLDQYKPHGYVNDFAGIINPQVQSQLAAVCEELDKATGTQLSIVTVVSLEGAPIKEFATQLANRWGVGHKHSDRGILVLLALNDRQYRIAVGQGLESVLTNEQADRLGWEMVPMLQKGDYGTAVLHLATRIQNELERK